MADFLIPLLLGGGVGAGSWLLDQIPGLGPKATNINKDYTNNPIWQMLFAGKGGGAYGKAQTGMDSFLQNAMKTADAYDPNSFWKDFMAAQPDMQGLISGPTGSFKASAEANLADFVKQATAETASDLSGMGALYSGALGSIAGQKIGAEAGKSNTDLAQLQASLMSQLWGSALPQFASGNQFKTNSMISAYLGGANTYASQLGQMLGIGSDLSAPTYVQQPGLADSIMSGLGLGLQGAGAYGMLNPPGGKKAASAAPTFDWSKLFPTKTPTGAGSFGSMTPNFG